MDPWIEESAQGSWDKPPTVSNGVIGVMSKGAWGDGIDRSGDADAAIGANRSGAEASAAPIGWIA